jgi:hypothetical protein
MHSLVKLPPHGREYPKKLFSQSSVVLTPRWSAQSGDFSTSCQIRYHQGNLHSRLGEAFSRPGDQLFSCVGESEDLPLQSVSLTPKWSTWLEKSITSCVKSILRCHFGTLWPRSHNVSDMNWRYSSLMCWDIRKCPFTIFNCAYTEAIHTIWQKHHLILSDTESSHQQNNMYLQWVLTPWKSDYLHTTVRPKTFRRDIPCLHRSGPHGAEKKSSSCLFDILRHHPDNLQP